MWDERRVRNELTALTMTVYRQRKVLMTLTGQQNYNFVQSGSLFYTINIVCHFRQLFLRACDGSRVGCVSTISEQAPSDKQHLSDKKMTLYSAANYMAVWTSGYLRSWTVDLRVGLSFTE